MTQATIVIPSRGGAAKLPVLFESLSRQTASDWDAIVVLDGDIDDSAAVVDEWATRIPVRRITFPENRGRAAALSAGFDAATGEVLIRCDDDLELSPEHVAGHIAHHAGEPTGVVGMCIDVFPPRNTYAAVYGSAANEAIRAHAYTLPPEDTWRLWAANVSVTRATYDRVGPYDSSFREYGWEDVEWGYRLHKLGLPVLVAPALEARHHAAALSTSMRSCRAFSSGRARMHFESKHGSGCPSAETDERAGAWNALVAALAGSIDERTLPRISAAADRLIPMLPRYLATKVVAVIVEASALAGAAQPASTPDRTPVATPVDVLASAGRVRPALPRRAGPAGRPTPTRSAPTRRNGHSDRRARPTVPSEAGSGGAGRW